MFARGFGASGTCDVVSRCASEVEGGLLRAAGVASAAERQHRIDVRVRARDHVDRDDLADALGSALASFGRRLHGRDVAADDSGDVAATGLLVADELDLRCLDHGGGGFDHTDEALHFDHTECVSHLSSPQRSTNFSGSLPVTPLSAAVAAAAAASISASGPAM